MNHYSTLGVPPGASAEEVRQAYLRLAKRHHPDKNKSPDATAMMAEINLAYETLCDIHKRQEYDIENGIATDVEHKEEEEIEQEGSQVFGRCVKCNFINSSGMFVCSVCGYAFDPETRSRKVDEVEDDEKEAQDSMLEIIRCPQCNEINMYSRGSCWQCGLQFEIGEIA